MRSVVPSLESNLNPPWKAAIVSKIAELQAKSGEFYNIGAEDLPELMDPNMEWIRDAVSFLYKFL